MSVLTSLFKKPKVQMPVVTPAATGPDPEKVAELAQQERIRQQQQRRGRSLTLATSASDGGTLLTGGNRTTLG